MEQLHSYFTHVWLEEKCNGAAPESEYLLHIKKETAPINRSDPTTRES
jgi:hypothetical protein